MAVYTEVDAAMAASLLRDVGAGNLLAMTGCASGIENTNYFVTSDRGEWVLTVFERLRFDQLPFYLGLMRHLALKGLPVPAPRSDASGNLVHALAGKPAALVDRLSGRSIDDPTASHCAQLGALLARLHDAALDFPVRQPNLRGLAWWEKTIPVVEPHVDAHIVSLLESEIAFQRAFQADPATRGLPSGAVHADLFRDNALFDGPPAAPHLSGVFDFYFAGVDHHVYDLAVCINDWCVDRARGVLDAPRARALVSAYHAARPMTASEVDALPGMRRAAALRFWLSRLADWYLPREAALLQPKDPAHFERVLVDCIANPCHVAP